MSLSKPTELFYDFVAMYLSNLYTNPVKTKAITSCLTASLGNYLSQKMSKAQHINQDSIVAFGLFGLFFGGPVPHYFYRYIPYFVKNPLAILAVERLLYTPCFQGLALYMIARFEGKSHGASLKNIQELYWPILEANWKYLTILQFINIRYVPPLLRVLFMNIIGVLWSIFLTKKRENLEATKRIQP